MPRNGTFASWEDLDRLVADRAERLAGERLAGERLAGERLAGERFDVVVAITRGGLGLRRCRQGYRRYRL